MFSLRGCCLVLVLGGATLASARDIFVDNAAGDDTFTGVLEETGTLAEGPVRTLAKALRLAQAGDRIVLKNNGQPYRESVALEGARHSGNGVAPFILEGNGAMLDGSAVIPAGAWEVVEDDVYRYRPYRLVYEQVFKADRRLERRVPAGNATWRAVLDEDTWALDRGRVYVRVSPGTRPGEQPYSHTRLTVGLTLHRVHDVVVSNLVVRGYQLDGVSLPEGVRQCTLVDVECRDNGRAGIALGGTSQAQLLRCRVAGNGEAELLTTALGRVELVETDAVAVHIE